MLKKTIDGGTKTEKRRGEKALFEQRISNVQNKPHPHIS
jgi:hypothetical protein